MSATEPGTGGHEAGQAREGDIPNLQRQLEAERAGATYWRERAQHHESALAEIKSRTGVRAVLALERRTAGIRRRAKAVAAEVQAAGSRSALTISALPTRAVIPSRRRALDEAVAQANRMPPLDLRPVLVVCIGVASPPAWAASVASRSTASGSITVTVSEIEDLPEVVSQADDEIELICLVDAQVEPLTSTWLDHLYGSLTENDAAAATGVMVHPQRALAHSTPHDCLIRSAGFEVLPDTSGAPSVVPLLAGSIVSRAVDRTVDLAGGAMLLVDRQAAVAAGGFDRWGSADACAVDLCSRLNRRARAVTVASAALGIDHRDVTDRRGLRRPFDETAPVWCDLLERCGPALRRSAATDRNAPTSFTFAVAAPSPKVADRWGDWHLAEAMSRALRSAGYGAAVHTQSERNDPGALCADVQVVVRGLAGSTPTPGRHQVLWVISHPEDLQITECDRADLVLVASKLYADHLATLTSTPVGVLLQATDTARFRPVPTNPDRHHDVVVVAKSRDVLRPMVSHALAAGLRPAIYGSGWDHLIDPSLIVCDHIDNESLPELYSSAGVVLNDHWDTMRHWGFLSNRLFDVLACGTPVISDPIPGLGEHLGDLVPTCSTPGELADLVRGALSLNRDAFAERARTTITAAHTFTQRARELTNALAAAGVPIHHPVC